ncbi:hypothetical protein BUALT_Bualt19G0117200 [Buddleja alternifolia]|uniref:non-specific serine/threonine protein kinase n=1 Tax=Buddleja alternifolia TaxID=168488 RepID=A0AAV6W7F6_9LAMI|nr:hypothetical protein BUALT_Bualt19G0117200 [Buddleja alternifolia]
MSSSPPTESPPSDSKSSDSPSPPSNSSPPPPSDHSSSSSTPPSSPPPPSDSSPSPPPPSDSSPSPPPPSDSKSSPPPPSNSSPPPKDNSSSPPPPKDSDSKSPPPPSNNNSPPPPSNNKSPPSNDDDDDNNSSGNNSNNNNNNNNNSPSPPRSHSPPTPPSRSTPSPPSRSGSALSSRGQSPPSLAPSSDDGQKAIIAGAAVGAGLLLLLFIAILVCCCRRKKRKRLEQMNYYRDNSHGNDYFNSGPNGNWHNPNRTSSHHMVKMPPPLDSGAVSSEHGWRAAPPPPPPMMSSSELSSAAFSGPHQPPLPPPHPAMALGFNQSSFTYDDLAAATNGFSQSNLLGQGGFGFVHKGVLPNGKEIAVKSLKANSGQGEREFQAEVDIISRVHHRHLVSLVGYCIAGSQRMLVYEFVSNGTLEYHLHGAGRPTMDWPTRLRIAMGSAKGFAYLHEDCHPRIIHRDIKAANILLEDNFEAKVADFGLAKLSSDTNTHVSTRIMGTFGYLAPEYAQSGKLTEKSDVYSYGIMLLELITGRRPVDITRGDDDDTLIDWARPILVQVAEGGSFEKLVDPKLENNYDHQEMLRMVACAGACIRHSARRRPKMSQIVRALEGDVSLDDLNDGVKPGSALFGSSSSSDYDLKKFGKGGALSSQEFSSSEHGVTGEYVHSNDGNSQEIGTRTRRSP